MVQLFNMDISNIVKKTLLILFVLFSSSRVQAQFHSAEAVDISLGYGLSVPYDDVGFYGTGFYIQGEYVLGINEWMDLRPYAGYVLTNRDRNLSGLFEPGDKANANAFLFGGKARFRMPIDWVAPYAEIGLGGSIGSFQTLTDNSEIDESGIYAHIPFSLGLELGQRHNVNVELTCYFHNSIKQFAGAMAIGVSFPVGYYR